MTWGPEQPTYVYACRLANFGNSPALNIEAVMTFTLQAAIKTESGSTSGPVVKTYSMATPRVSLQAGQQNIFEFYVRNRSEYFVQVSLPETALAQSVGSNERQTVQLIPPASEYERVFGLVPFSPVEEPKQILKDPPAATPPAPKPPRSPKRT
jgi:hypothetical protein